MNLILNSQSKALFFLSIIVSILYIFLTNNFFNFDQSLIYGAADGATYMAITKNFPNVVENGLAYTHNQRFLVPYLIGFINSFTNVDFFFECQTLQREAARKERRKTERGMQKILLITSRGYL